MAREVVRNLGSNMTHLADTAGATVAVFAGATYTKPLGTTRALCGVHIDDGVVMRPGTKMKCRVCRALDEPAFFDQRDDESRVGDR